MAASIDWAFTFILPSFRVLLKRGRMRACPYINVSSTALVTSYLTPTPAWMIRPTGRGASRSAVDCASSQPMGWNVPQQNFGAQQVVAVVPTQTPFAQATAVGTHPLAIECSENQSEYVLSCDVPGIQAEDIEVSVEGATLQINGRRKGQSEKGHMNYSEIPTGVFSRSIALPFEITGDKGLNTTLENGVLKIRMNKQSAIEKKINSSRKMRIG